MLCFCRLGILNDLSLNLCLGSAVRWDNGARDGVKRLPLPPPTSQGWSLVPTPRPCSAGGAWAHLPQGRGCPVGVRHSICDRPHACRSVTLKTNKTHHDRSGEIMEERKSLFCFPAFWIRGPAFLFCSGPCELCSCSALLTRSLVVLNNYTDLFVCIRECC